MSKVLRALLISAVATGIAAALLGTRRGGRSGDPGQRAPSPPPEAPERTASGAPIVDADALSPAEKSRLTDELDGLI